MINKQELKMKNEIDILWLSDIHWKAEYAGNRYSRKYIETFLEKVKVRRKPFDYIIISGDIAYNGKENDYNSFEESVLSNLFNERTRYLFCPGNHDLNNDKVKGFYNNFFDQFKNKDQTNRNKLISGMKEEFSELFQEYAAFCSKFEPLKSAPLQNFQDSDHFKNLFGLYEDKQNGIIFLVINSSWFSFTEKIYDDIIAEKYLSKWPQKKEKRKEKLLEILELKENSFTQYGRMYYGDKLLEPVITALKEIKCEYINPITIILVHHPINWMDWQTQFSVDSGTVDVIFNDFIDQGDILLVGHEHAHLCQPDYLQNSLLQLRASKFLCHKVEASYSEPHFDKYGFRELTINSFKKELKVTPFMLNTENDNIHFSKEQSKTYEIRSLFYNKNADNYLKCLYQKKLSQKQKFDEFSLKQFFLTRGISISYIASFTILGNTVHIYNERPGKIRCILPDIIKSYEEKHKAEGPLYIALSILIILTNLYIRLKEMYSNKYVDFHNFIVYLQFVDMWDKVNTGNNNIYNNTLEEIASSKKHKEILFDSIKSRFVYILQLWKDSEYKFKRINEPLLSEQFNELDKFVSYKEDIFKLPNLRYTYEFLDVLTWTTFRKEV